MSDVIDSFDKEFEFLSNFFPCPIIYNGYIYSSTEAAYQSAKCPGNEKIFCHLRANEAKKFARKLKSRDDWHGIKLNVMRDLLKNKFSKKILAELLKNTYPKELIEGNYWNDTFWGICNGEGENNLNLGKLLMEIREEIIN